MDVVVVGAAIARDGLVLAARRRRPSALAGRWEFPGGKVERGESDAQALQREVAEELGAQISCGALLASAELPGGGQLRVYRAGLRAGEPRPGPDHDELRWLAPDRLAELDWLEPDLPAVAALSPQTGPR